MPMAFAQNSCSPGQTYDSIRKECYTPHPFTFEGFVSPVVVGDTLGGVVTTTRTDALFGATGQPDGIISDFGYWDNALITEEHVGVYEITVTMYYAATRKTIKTFELIVLACPVGQRLDSNDICYIPEPIRFSGLKRTYSVGEPLTGNLGFIDSTITATSYTVTGQPSGIALNPDGTWTNSLLTSAHTRTHNMQVTANYIVDGIQRQSVKLFAIDINSCTPGQNFNTRDNCYTPHPFTFEGFVSPVVVGDTLGGVATTTRTDALFDAIGQPDGIISDFGYWDNALITQEHVGVYEIIVIMYYNATRKTVMNFELVVLDCPAGQTRDSANVCYAPESFEFQDLRPKYMIGESLTGTLHFANITTTNYTITSGALPNITLNPNGTWAENTLAPTHVGNHTIQVAANYTVNGGYRESVKSFSFEVTPCDNNQYLDSGACVDANIQSLGYRFTQLVDDSFIGNFTINDPFASNTQYSISGQPSGLTINSTTGSLDAQLITRAHLGEYNLTITISYTNSRNVEVTLTRVFPLTVFECPAGQSHDENACYTPLTIVLESYQNVQYAGDLINGSAQLDGDLDGTGNYGPYIITGLPNGIPYTVNGSLGDIRGTTLTCEHVGDYDFVITRTYDQDGGNRIATGEFSLTIQTRPGTDCNDDMAPVIVVNANTTITLQVGDNFTEPSFNVTDNDPNYRGIVTVTTTPSMVDTSAVGNYTITYAANSDAAGNVPDIVTLNVLILDTTLPVIMINPRNITLQIADTFTPPTVTVSDNDPAYAGIVTNTTAPSPVDTSSVGNFTITYNATADAAGNIPVPVILFVQVISCNSNQILDVITSTCVIDTEKPVIAVSSANITLKIGETYTAPTFNVTDNDPAYSGTVNATTTPGIVDTSNIGVFTITYTAPDDASGNSPDNVTATVEIVGCDSNEILVNGTCVVDTILPTITITGSSSVTILQNSIYMVLPPTISDNDPSYDGSFTASHTIDPLDTSSIGIVTITYNATDTAGNVGTASQDINIIAQCPTGQVPDSDDVFCIPDIILPVIMINPTNRTLQIGQTFTPPTVNVTDNDPSYVGTITNTTSPGPIDTSRIGSFTITYMATADAAGNSPVSVNATVEIVDTTAPIIETSYTNITLQIGQTFTPPTVNVTDNDPSYVGTITNSTSPGPVDTSSVGVFAITYNATADAAGNVPTSVMVTVNVTGCDSNQILDSATNTCITDTELPTIKVNPSSITLEIDEPFTLPTVNVTDNDPSYVGTITNSTSPGPVDTSRIGSFTITYMATADAAGNAPLTVTATVEIVDTTAPIIETSYTNITLQIGQTFTPPTVNVTDNDPSYVGTITNSTTPDIVDTSSVGVFTITYNATADASGNAPTLVIVTVNVAGCDSNQILDSATNTCITDTELPTIEVNPSSITLEIDEPFTLPTVNVTDNDPSYVGTISNSTSPGPVNTTNVGTFTITYNGTADAAGNAPLTVTATVEIVDTTAPIIETSYTNITLQIGQTFTPPTVNVTDNDPSYSGTITNTTSPGPVDTSSVGVFTITYNATADAAGNVPTSVMVTVNVTGCDSNQILDSATNTCITDTELPTIEVNPSSITLEIDEPFTPPIVNVTDNDPSYVGTISNSTSPGPIDTSRIGSFTITYMATADAAGNAPVSVNATVEIVDTTAPIIETSYTNITLQIGQTFTPPTVNVTDNDPSYVGTITNTTSPGPVDTSSVGVFTITYNATADASGNAPTSVMVTVNVTGCDSNQILDSATNTCITDTELPTIEVNPSSITLEIDEPFTLPTVNVTDNDPSYVGTITNTTSPGPIDTSRIGSFTITYMATADAAGNAPVSVNATVEIVDTTAPIIETSSTNITLQIGQTFTPPTVNVTDNDLAYSGTITNTTSPGPVDTSSVGTFTITYNGTADAAGNAPLTVTATVEIIDTTAPIIETSSTSITLQIDQTFTPPTVTISDNDPSYVGTITNTTSPGPVDTSSVGTFTITYNGTADASNNVPIPIAVTVEIVDTTAPIIETSSTSITLQIGQTFTPPTVTISDNDPAYVGTITPTPSSIDTSSVGTFTIRYTGTADAAGNIPVPVELDVIVTACPTNQILESNTCVIDTAPPVIMINSTTLTLRLGESFTPPTVTVSDNDPAYSGTLTNTTSPSPVDTTSIRTFTISYTAPPDAANNVPVPVIATVEIIGCAANQILVGTSCVADTAPPVIMVNPADPQTFLVGTLYREPAATISDNDPNYRGVITTTTAPGPVDTSSAGNFTVTYTANSDASGNTPISKIITIAIVASCTPPKVQDHLGSCITDTTPPVITIPGPRFVTILVDANYTQPNAIVLDNTLDYNETVTHTSSSIDTNAEGTFTITYDGLPDASGNQPVSIVLTVNVVTECPANQIPNLDNICIVSSNGGSSSEWKTKPTFGVSWENNQPFVNDGFTLNNHTLDITDNWHTDFVLIGSIIGDSNNVKIKTFAPKGLRTVMLSLGVPEVGKVTDAETDIIISIQPNYTSVIDYSITGITHEQKESLVDETQTTATLSKSSCSSVDIMEKCYTVDINFVVLAPLKSDPIAITAVDAKNRYTTTYINAGVEFIGDSLLEPATAQLVTKKGNQYVAETIELVKQDRRYNLWEDQYGNYWTQNDHDTWIQLTFPEITIRQDPSVSVMTRMHSTFSDELDAHTQSMESLRDSLFKDVYIEPYDDLDEPITIYYTGESRQEKLANNPHYKLD